MLKKMTSFLLSGTLTVTALFSGCSDSVIQIRDGKTASQRIDAMLNDIQERKKNTASENKCTVNIGEGIDITGEGAWFEGNILTISEGGEYRLSGNIIDGSVYIETDDDVKLILDGLKIYNSEGTAVYCYKAKNLSIELSENKENIFSDCAEYTFEGKNESKEENEPNAALFSNSDIAFSGNGALKINGSYDSGISCVGEISLNGGTITVDAVGNGIKSGIVKMKDGNLTLKAGKSGIYARNKHNGGVVISGGKITVNSSDDCISSEEGIVMSGGTAVLVSEFGEGLSAAEEPEIKGGKLDFFKKEESAA